MVWVISEVGRCLVCLCLCVYVCVFWFREVRNRQSVNLAYFFYYLDDERRRGRKMRNKGN